MRDMKLANLAWMLVALVGCAGTQTPVARSGTGSAGEAACPERVRDSSKDGQCLDENELGADVVKACADVLVKRGWMHDPRAEQMLAGRSGRVLSCYRAP